MPYIPNTDKDREIMLKKIGVSSFSELLAPIPEKALIKHAPNKALLDLPPALSEMELNAEFAKIAAENKSLVCFAGGGVYDHFIPSAVNSIISRPEFMTAYTPYQPEVAQGTLQVIYEFQTHICRLTGMEVANASMYDGASSTAEAVLTAISHTKRKRVIISETLNPLYLGAIHTYAHGFDADFATLEHHNGQSALAQLSDLADDQTACFVISQPNFFGLVEDIEQAAQIIHSVGAMLIVVADPHTLAALKAPGSQGADIVVGEAQPLGIPISFGGPLLGYFAISKKLVRKLPGRLVARTTDVDGKTGFTLTLQTREQHIKRARATSNICTNQALCATAATVYTSLMGKQGLRQAALLSMERAHYAAEEIAKLPGFQITFDGPFFREFVVTTPLPAAEIVERLIDEGILAGVDLGRFYPGYENKLLIAFTEKRTVEEVDRLVACFREFSVRDSVSEETQESFA